MGTRGIRLGMTVYAKPSPGSGLLHSLGTVAEILEAGYIRLGGVASISDRIFPIAWVESLGSDGAIHLNKTVEDLEDCVSPPEPHLGYGAERFEYLRDKYRAT